VRRRAPYAVAALGLLALAAAVAAFAAQHDARRAASIVGHPPCAPPAPGNHEIVVQDGRAAVILHVPPGKPPHRRRALVLVLPGAGMTATDMGGLTGYSRLASLRGFLVAYPTASGKRPSWSVSGSGRGARDDVAYLRKVITSLTGDTACADRERVGVTGAGNGGAMTALMACRAADLLAAAAPVAGGSDATLPDCRPQRPLPVLVVNGLRAGAARHNAKGSAAAAPYLATWRRRNGCGSRPHRSAPARNAQELRWRCAGGRTVIQDRVLETPQGWPGGPSFMKPYSTTLRSWRFISAFRGRGERSHRARTPTRRAAGRQRR
jgi:polyhydroxybutyrate depolymerase